MQLASRTNRLFAYCLAALLVALVVSPAYAAGRVALVIGNSAYENVSRLPNPENDAQDMSAALAALGFDVHTVQNVDKAALEVALADFADRAVGADIALVFYAGHGIEVDRRNYLIPIDARLETDRRLMFEAVPLDAVMASLDTVKGVRIVLLDACRNNPFAASMKGSSATRSIGRGLSRVEAPAGTLVSFAAKEGTVAADGDGRNSPFTSALLSTLGEPVEIGLLFRRVRDSVLAATNGQQEPYVSASLPSEPIYFVPPQAAGSSQPGTSPAQAWDLVKDTGNPDDLRAFVEMFPETFHARLAANRLKELARRDTQELAALPSDADTGATTHRARPRSQTEACAVVHSEGRALEYCVSSVLEPQFGFRYGPDKALDNTRSTAWVEGVAGSGIGEWLIADLDCECRVDGIEIVNGYPKSPDIYSKNGRISRAELVFSDGTTRRIVLQDTSDPQRIAISPPVSAQWVQIRILDVYRGTKYEDTALGEFRVLSQP